jgi:ATP-dependent exoDNAse (exonuclease V) alpha subunit
LEEVVATCDRLLGDLDRGRERLDARTVLVVSEAAMVGSRKLTRLLEQAEQAQAKVVLVGDARQLAAIDAGGGFHPPPPPRRQRADRGRHGGGDR